MEIKMVGRLVGSKVVAVKINKGRIIDRKSVV